VPADGTYLAGWLQYQVFIPIALLQGINLFWYYLILRILVRYVAAVFYFKQSLIPVRTILISETDDDRSDDEGDEEEEQEKAPVEKEKEKTQGRLKETSKPSKTAAAK
jgi:acyl-CoA-dependent ceramide synthase